jgi:glycerol-3-phosphate dehydrogenase
MLRKTNALEETGYDLVVIGGGITGACIACDAAVRGMSVALVEKGDFGAATSSASSKLLHGGIRYLQKGRLLKLRESALERAYFQTLAPHLCHYVPFVVPAYGGLKKGKLLLGLGLGVYEALCLGQNKNISDPAKQVPKGQLLSKADVREYVPEAYRQEVTGGILLYESHMRDSERMTLSFLKTAAEHGAAVANYTRAEAFQVEGNRVTGIRVSDLLDGSTMEIRSSMVINAAGPWIPSNIDKLDSRANPRTVTGLAKGAHIVTKPLTDGHAMALPIREQNEALLNRGGRHVFIIPWQGHSLIGTTYSAFEGDPDDVTADESDVRELMQIINAAFGTEVLTRREVVHAYAGLYPLTAEQVKPEVYQGTDDYQVVDHEQTDQVEGFVSAFGAKFTTARRLAEKAVTLVAGKLQGDFSECRTHQMRLAGGEINDIEAYRERKKKQYQAILSAEVVDHLVSRYGTKIDSVANILEEEPELNATLSPGSNTLAAEVVYTARNEMACRLEDVVFRRSNLGLLGHSEMSSLRRCAELMARERGWDNQRIEQEIQETEEKFLDNAVQSAKD